MKNIFITIIVILLSIPVVAQSSKGFNYQAVIRDSEDELVSEGAVSLRISILEGSESGSAVYIEIHDVTTNLHGLVSLTIGSGDSSDDFSAITWGTTDYFIKMEVDVEGGDSYMDMGTSQLLPVPYAMHAFTTDSIFGNTIDSTHIINGSISHNDIDEGPGSGLNADLLDGYTGIYYQNATNINSGTLNNARFSAQSDLYSEGYLDNNSSNDILTRSQADARYNSKVAFFAYRSTSQTVSSAGVTKIDFSTEKMDPGYDFNLSTDRFYAPYDGVYSFSGAAYFGSIATGYVRLHLYVNGVYYLTFDQVYTDDITYYTLNGSATISLSDGDYVELVIYTSDDDAYSIIGSSAIPTWFSGHLVFQDL